MRLIILTVTLLVLSSFPFTLGGCSSSSDSPSDGGTHDVTLLCVPGQSVACVGPGGCSGGQVCGTDGASFGPCDCSHPSSEAGNDGSSPADATTDADGATLADASTDADAAAGDVAVADVATTDSTTSDVTSGDAPLEAETSTGDSGSSACQGQAPTTISGKVYDPAGKNPVYGVDVYVPSGPLPALPKGVPTGLGACTCSALSPSGMLAKTKTGADGMFTLTGVPAGNVTLVLQIGKWRRVIQVNVTACHDNPQPDKSLRLPATVAPGSDDTIPDIAVSTGGADTLECLLLRVGLPSTEYVAGAATSGHVHVFSGGQPGGSPPRAGVGSPETNPMPGAPESDTNLWDSAAHLMPYDITLLSCEGGETYNANPSVLEQYLNAGGRVFASHFHYAWFAGPISSTQMYSAPSDWGANLATWTAGSNTSATNPIGGIVDTTLNGSSTAFPKGLALQQWLSNVGALGQGVAAGEVSIYQPRYNAVVGSSNKASQPLLTSDSSGMAGQTMAFSFNTPVDLNPPANPTTCGRAVYSDLHVGGNPSTNDNPPPPGGCDTADLSPQEKVLEFMLFDLSGCVVPDSSTP